MLTKDGRDHARALHGRLDGELSRAHADLGPHDGWVDGAELLTTAFACQPGKQHIVLDRRVRIHPLAQIGGAPL